MKILCITFWGSWTRPFLNEISKCNQIEVIVPNRKKEPYKTEEYNGIMIHYIHFEYMELFSNMTKKTFNKYDFIISQFNPDIIHVHGTEKNLAQIVRFTNIPVIVSIQGILEACCSYSRNYLTKGVTRRFKSLKNFLGRGHLVGQEKIYKRGFTFERWILENNHFFIGRTDFDRAWIQLENPLANYYYAEELFREDFYLKKGCWNVTKCRRHTIMMPAGFNPLKGLHLAIKTVSILKSYYPDIELKVPGVPVKHINSSKFRDYMIGEEYITYIKWLIKKENVENNVILMGQLSCEEMISEMLNANVFLSPTSIDNSPNAVGEASMLGLPIVVTPVGGIPSIWTDKVNCLFAPAGDSHIMAMKIKQLFENDYMANVIGRNAYELADLRHAKETVVNQYLSAYRDVISKSIILGDNCKRFH